MGVICAACLTVAYGWCIGLGQADVPIVGTVQHKCKFKWSVTDKKPRVPKSVIHKCTINGWPLDLAAGPRVVVSDPVALVCICTYAQPQSHILACPLTHS